MTACWSARIVSGSSAWLELDRRSGGDRDRRLPCFFGRSVNVMNVLDFVSDPAVAQVIERFIAMQTCDEDPGLTRAQRRFWVRSNRSLHDWAVAEGVDDADTNYEERENEET